MSKVTFRKILKAVADKDCRTGKRGSSK